jgi:DNA-binding beta-propeller fold protein YncE
MNRSLVGILAAVWIISAPMTQGAPFLQVRQVLDAPSVDSERITMFEQTPSGHAEVLWVRKAVLMDESAVAGVAMSVDGVTHQGMVQLQMNGAGRRRLADITRQNTGHRLAIILDGRLYCAPFVAAEITGGVMMITGALNHDQAAVLAGRLSEHLRGDNPGRVSTHETEPPAQVDAGEPAPSTSVIPPAPARRGDNSTKSLSGASRLPPQIVWQKSVKGPLAVKAMEDGSVYVLNDRPPTFQWLNANGTIRAKFNLTEFHPAPLTASGFDVDDKGQAYIAMTSLNKVLMLRPSGTASYEPSVVFENGPELALRAPWDVAVTPDGASIFVSDSGNHRVARLLPPLNAVFIKGFSEPRGLCLNALGDPMVADPKSQGVWETLDNNILDSISSPGALKASATSEVIYVTDGISVRQYDSESHVLLAEIPRSIGLRNPRGVSAWPVGFEQRVYIADYGNNRVVGVSFPRPDPILVWNALKKAVASKDMSRALSYFSLEAAGKYRAEFQSVGLARVAQILGQTANVKVVSMSENFASCAVVSPVNGKDVLFYINFSNDNGTWKIDSF